MKKKIKLDLKSLEVKSFTTSLTDEQKEILKGGTGALITKTCNSVCYLCEETDRPQCLTIYWDC